VGGGGRQTAAKTTTAIQKLQPLKTANDIGDDEVEKYQSMWVHLCVMNINEAQRA